MRADWEQGQRQPAARREAHDDTCPVCPHTAPRAPRPRGRAAVPSDDAAHPNRRHGLRSRASRHCHAVKRQQQPPAPPPRGSCRQLPPSRQASAPAAPWEQCVGPANQTRGGMPGAHAPPPSRSRCARALQDRRDVWSCAQDAMIGGCARGDMWGRGHACGQPVTDAHTSHKCECLLRVGLERVPHRADPGEFGPEVNSHLVAVAVPRGDVPQHLPGEILLELRFRMPLLTTLQRDQMHPGGRASLRRRGISTFHAAARAQVAQCTTVR